MPGLVLLLSLLVAAATASVTLSSYAADEITCRDLDNKAIDYWMGLKGHNGADFYQMNPELGRFMTPPQPLEEATKSVVGTTLANFYANSTKLRGFVLYNDENPKNRKYEKQAHSKGVLLVGDQTAVWLSHSVPRFPEYQAEGYSFEKRLQRYGQSFLCLTVSVDTMNDISKFILYNQPALYETRADPSLQSEAPAFFALAQTPHYNYSTVFAGQQVLKTVAGTNFRQFARSGAWNQRLYADLVEPYYKIPMLWETWQNGRGKVPTCCPGRVVGCTCKFTTTNILDVQMPDMVTWKETEDHSKWGLADASTNAHIVCLGDLNRQEHQVYRGGGTVCIDNKPIWSGFHDIITKVNSTCSCPT